MSSPDDRVAPPAPDGAAETPAPAAPAPARAARAARAPRRSRRVRGAAPPPGAFAPRRRWEKSPAGLVSLVAFLWGMSLLVHDWLRTEWFEPHGLSSSLLSAPFFAAAVASALLAMRARSAGRPALGGPGIHRFGLASGLVSASALGLALWMGPRVLEMQEQARVLQARRQLDAVAAALDAHARATGGYPEGAGARSLGDALGGSLPLRDPWGRELDYRSLDGGRGYLLLSLGRDGEADVPLSDYADATRRYHGGDDLVVLSGERRAAPPARGEPSAPAPPHDPATAPAPASAPAATTAPAAPPPAAPRTAAPGIAKPPGSRAATPRSAGPGAKPAGPAPASSSAPAPAPAPSGATAAARPSAPAPAGSPRRVPPESP